MSNFTNYIVYEYMYLSMYDCKDTIISRCRFYVKECCKPILEKYSKSINLTNHLEVSLKCNISSLINYQTGDMLSNWYQSSDKVVSHSLK